MTRVPLRRGGDTQIHTRKGAKRRPGRDGSDAATSRVLPATPEAGRGKEQFFSGVCRESMVLPTPSFCAFSLQNCERNKCLLFKATRFMAVCSAAIGTNAGVQLDCGIKNKEGGAICLSPAMTVHLIQLILSHLILTFNSYLLLLGGNYYYVCFTKQVTELQGS